TPVGAVYDRPGAHRTPLQLEVAGSWTAAFSGKARVAVENGLAEYLQAQRWFRGKARQIKSTGFAEMVPANWNSTEASITQIRVEYPEDAPKLYLLPTAFASGEQAEHVRKSYPASILAELNIKQKGEDR